MPRPSISTIPAAAKKPEYARGEVENIPPYVQTTVAEFVNVQSVYQYHLEKYTEL